MAYDANEQYVSGDLTGSGLRAFATQASPKTFAAGTALLAKLTPVAFNSSTGQWVVWASAGINDTSTIRGFVWPDEVQLVAGVEVLGVVMLAGRVHYDDIALPSGEVQANLKTALQVGPRQLGLIIEGVDGVR